MSTSSLESATPPSIALPARVALPRRWAVAYGLFTAASSARFTQAIWVIFLAAHGYSPFAIGIFEMIFHLAKFIAEVPTGIFADLAGRRASLIVSCALSAGAGLLYLAPAAPLIALSLALSGVSFAFRGGADSAMLWTLSERAGGAHAAARYSRLFSRMFLIMLAGEMLGSGAGGFLSGVAASLPFLAQSAILLVAIVPLFLLPEQRLASSHRTSPLAHLRTGMYAVWRDPVLLGLLLISGLLAGIFTTVNIYGQLYFSGLGFSVAAVGIIFAVAIGPDALYAALAPRLIHRVPRNLLLAGCVVSEAAGLLAMCTGQPLLGIVGFLLLFHPADSVVMAAISRYLNERAPEAQRATVLSLDTGIFSAVMIVLFPLFGLGLTHISFGTAYFGTFVALLAGSITIAGIIRLLLRRTAR
jgi:MFS family permease